MGITNFCKLIDPLLEPLNKPEYFDAILFDVQSLLHVGVSMALEKDEAKVFREICKEAWSSFKSTLDRLLSQATADHITVIVSFDGEGVPMKWPTQKERRRQKKVEGKAKYRMILFGVNKLALQVQAYFVKRCRLMQPSLPRVSVYISGCNAPGEGEHKIFQMAEALQKRNQMCQHPIVVSVDQDVFVLALMRLDRYQSLQIHRYGKFYPVKHLYHDRLPYSMAHLEVVSFLFGNDFIPALVAISPINVPAITQSLIMEDEQHPVDVLAKFIQAMRPHIRFQEVTHMDVLLVQSFWITYFWLKDYYTRTKFPQKYLENPIYSQFDRNALLTALSTPSRTHYDRAKTTYEGLELEPVTAKQAEYAVFGQDNVQLTSYFVQPTDSACIVIHLTKLATPTPASAD